MGIKMSPCKMQTWLLLSAVLLDLWSTHLCFDLLVKIQIGKWKTNPAFAGVKQCLQGYFGAKYFEHIAWKDLLEVAKGQIFHHFVKLLKKETSVLRCNFSNTFWATSPLAHPGWHYWNKWKHVPLKLLLTPHEQLQSYIFLSATKPPICRTIKKQKYAVSNATDAAQCTLTTTCLEIFF